MKLIHLSDLHLGKRVHEVSMLPEQILILNQILQIVDEEQPQALLVCGDVYDKTVPSGMNTAPSTSGCFPSSSPPMSGGFPRRRRRKAIPMLSGWPSAAWQLTQRSGTCC